ncbi:MAG: class II aldolase/adducin family protein [Bacteroidetes bacterium]|jgi:L-ribulose-5-phosphate 4-epimerase|nr:class II aldolase/adducin family protein [Bacteroidota bacterium]
MQEEGVIKYQCHHRPGTLPVADLLSLHELRQHFYQLGGIGYDSLHQVGYGNASVRVAQGFIITASQTGHLPALSGEHLSWVYRCAPSQNELWCQGRYPASSEAMTHHSIYETRPEVQLIAHIHHPACWQQGLHRLPTTPADVAYGTPEMATCVAALLGRHTAIPGLFLTAGHTDGVFVYAQSLEELLSYWEARYPG